jgi:hypothetical protein
MHEIDFKTANFDDIAKFAGNLLTLRKIDHPHDYDSQIGYFSAATQVLVGRKVSENVHQLAIEIDAARSAVGKGLDKLTVGIANASSAAELASQEAVKQSRRMVRATWALVIVTGFLGFATAGLMFYTRELVMTPPTFVTVPGAK